MSAIEMHRVIENVNWDELTPDCEAKDCQKIDPKAKWIGTGTCCGRTLFVCEPCKREYEERGGMCTACGMLHINVNFKPL
jgi:hypothetical protein